jgi:hypothetical protein
MNNDMTLLGEYAAVFMTIAVYDVPVDVPWIKDESSVGLKFVVPLGASGGVSTLVTQQTSVETDRHLPPHRQVACESTEKEAGGI